MRSRYNFFLFKITEFFSILEKQNRPMLKWLVSLKPIAIPDNVFFNITRDEQVSVHIVTRYELQITLILVTSYGLQVKYISSNRLQGTVR